MLFYSDCQTCPEDTENDMKPPKLERQMSRFDRICERSLHTEVDVGSGIKVPVRLNPQEVYLLKQSGRFPNALEPEMKFESDGVFVTAKRTPIGLDRLENLIDDRYFKLEILTQNI